MSIRRSLVAAATKGLDLIRPIVERLAPGRPVVLCYHSVVDRPIPVRLTQTGLHLPLEDWRLHLDYLATHCEVVPVTRLLEPGGFATRRRSRPRVAITLDDGYVNNLTIAAPELVSRGLPATVFVVTDSLATDRLFWWDELNWLLTAPHPGRGRLADAVDVDLSNPMGIEAAGRAIRAALVAALPAERARMLDELTLLSGRPMERWLLELLRPLTWAEVGRLGDSIAVGNHTATHRVLSAIEVADAVADVARAGKSLESVVPASRRIERAVCYPRGDSTSAVRAGLRAADVATWGFGLRSAGASVRHLDPMNLPRTIVGAGQSMARFRLRAAGLTG